MSEDREHKRTVPLCSSSTFIDNYVESAYSLDGDYAYIQGHCMHKWTSNLLDVLNVLGTATFDLIQPPNFEDITIYNKVNSQNFETNFIINGGQTPLSDIIERCIIN